ncbi:MAG: HYR domain-containing protein [Gemmatimonadaceae bacterium]
MRRSTALSALNLIRVSSASVAILAGILSCSDNTAPKAQAAFDPSPAKQAYWDSVLVGSFNASSNLVASGSAVRVGIVPSSIVGQSANLDAGSGPSYTKAAVDFAPEADPVNALPTASLPLVNGGDDGRIVDLPIGFDFNFYGNTYSKLNLYLNGFVTFGPAVAGDFYQVASLGGIPSTSDPNNMIAFAWSDWVPGNVPGSMTYETRGSAPNRRFVVQLKGVPESGGSGNLTAQLVLSEGSNDITMYVTHLNITNGANRVTQGIENAGGTEATFDSVMTGGGLSPRVRGFFSLTNDALRFSPANVAVNQPPVVVPPANFTVSTDAGVCKATVNIGVASVSDDAPGSTVAGVRSDAAALDAAYPKGVTTVTWTATDAGGLTASANQIVTVSDKENPSVRAPASIVVGNDPGQASASVPVGSADAQDNCQTVSVSGSRGDGGALQGIYPVGVTTITWTATDASGNTASATQYVTVRDQEAPSLTVPGDLALNATSPSGAAVTFAVSAVDNVGVTVVSCTPASGSNFPIGNTLVTCVVSDAAGNKSTKTFNVSVAAAPPQLGSLLQYLLSLNLPNGVNNPLVNQLIAVGDGSVPQACTKMGDFVSMLGKKGSGVADADYSYMLNEATRIMNVMSCPAISSSGQSMVKRRAPVGR